MSNPWVMIYYAPLIMLFVASCFARRKDYIFITFVSLVAFGVTRFITESGLDNRYVYDFVNDIFVCSSLLWFTQRDTWIKWLVFTYTLMALFAYIPSAGGFISGFESTVVLEVIEKVQLLLILGGLIHGRKDTRLSKHLRDSSGHNNIMARDKTK